MSCKGGSRAGNRGRQACLPQDFEGSGYQCLARDLNESFIGAHAAGLSTGQDKPCRIRFQAAFALRQLAVSSRKRMIDLMPSSKFFR